MSEQGPVTVAWVRSQLAEIESHRHDPEVAHAAEDGLYAIVLEAIAEGRCEDPPACAREALKSAELEFPRWCA